MINRSLDIYRMRSQRGFTMLEMIIVIAVILVLAGLLVPVLAGSRRTARITQCKSNLLSLYKGVFMYDSEHDRFSENYPGHLTELYRDRTVGHKSNFTCPLDESRGREGGKPPEVVNQYAELDEGPGRGVPAMPNDTIWSSYMYEFSSARCTWWEGWVEGPDGFPPYGPYFDESLGIWETDAIQGDDPEEIIDTNWDRKVTWQETKFYQQKYGDRWLHDSFEYDGGYPRGWFPMIRCFWHQRDPDVEANVLGVMNVSMDGNAFESGPTWELIATKNLDADQDIDSAADDFWEDEKDWEDFDAEP